MIEKIKALQEDCKQPLLQRGADWKGSALTLEEIDCLLDINSYDSKIFQQYDNEDQLNHEHDLGGYYACKNLLEQC
jgi:hypothetical protein